MNIPHARVFDCSLARLSQTLSQADHGTLVQVHIGDLPAVRQNKHSALTVVGVSEGLWIEVEPVSGPKVTLLNDRVVTGVEKPLDPTEPVSIRPGPNGYIEVRGFLISSHVGTEFETHPIGVMMFGEKKHLVSILVVKPAL